MILQVQEISKKFGGLQALLDVNFEIAEGQIMGLIGPNGAGKTTLFNVINGVYVPTQGQVIFRGENITGLPSYEVARRGLARAHQVVPAPERSHRPGKRHGGGLLRPRTPLPGQCRRHCG